MRPPHSGVSVSYRTNKVGRVERDKIPLMWQPCAPGDREKAPMNRREFIAGLASAAAWSLPAWAQQGAMPVIGFVRSAPLAGAMHLVTGFRAGLAEGGFVEGQNVTLELRSAEGEYNRLPTILAELNNKPIALIVGDNIAALAAKVATATIPIVFAGGGDPVKEGLVARLNRPGGNVTGVNFLTGVLGAKRLELLRQVAPNAASIAALVRPNTTETEAERKDLQDAAHAVGLELIMCDANTDRDIETAFATFAERRAGALLVGSGAFLFSHRQHVVALATHQALQHVTPLERDL